MEQTSVEFFIEVLSNYDSKIIELFAKEIEQVEEMHKNEIISAANIPKEQRWFDAKLYNSCGEQYYNKTYKQIL